MTGFMKNVMFLLTIILLGTSLFAEDGSSPSKNDEGNSSDKTKTQQEELELNKRHFLNRENYRTKTEGFSLGFFGGNYGLGGGCTFVTLRWRYFFWEILRIQITGAEYFKNNRSGVSANAKTMIGVPFFLDKTNRHELRISTGFSAGFTGKKSRDEVEDFIFYDRSNMNLPVDISYVFHKDKNVAFQVGVAFDFPLGLGDDFFLIINGFVGFRI